MSEKIDTYIKNIRINEINKENRGNDNNKYYDKKITKASRINENNNVYYANNKNINVKKISLINDNYEDITPIIKKNNDNITDNDDESTEKNIKKINNAFNEKNNIKNKFKEKIDENDDISFFNENNKNKNNVDDIESNYNSIGKKSFISDNNKKGNDNINMSPNNIYQNTESSLFNERNTKMINDKQLKNKNLEDEMNELNRNYNSLKNKYDTLIKENETLNNIKFKNKELENEVNKLKIKSGQN